MSRPYEVVVILDAGLDDPTIQATLERAAGVVSSGGGTQPRIDRWGRRRFAYELDHRWEGYYALLETNAEPAVMDELGRVLSLADEVIRHKIIRIPDKVAARASSGGRGGRGGRGDGATRNESE